MLRVMWKSCVILHSIIVADEEDEDVESYIDPIECTSTASGSSAFDQLLTGLARIQDRTAHTARQHDLIEHQ